ncbi:MAG: radical SAM protein [bacterium]
MSSKLFAQAQKILAAEKNIFLPSQKFSKHKLKEVLAIALAYPNRYYTGMSNLGFQTVYHLFNMQPGTECQRVFLPEAADIEEYYRTNTPLFSLETQRPVRNFDVLAFSISYENDYLHLLQIMELAKIPVLSKDRQETDPLVMAGGATVLLNPEPLTDFVDFFFIGEIEPIVGTLTEILRRGKEKELPRFEILRELAELEGGYVPQFYEITYSPEGLITSFSPQDKVPARVKRVYLRDLDCYPTLSAIITPQTELAEMLLTELSRGCSRRCRFCACSYVYHPHRLRDGSELKKVLLQHGEGASKIGLLGAAISDYPHLLYLGRELLSSQKSLSFSSLRVDALNQELADLLRDSGQKTVTLAPEAGSERMRRIIHKGFQEQNILEAVELLADRGVANLRLYFMIGLPWEEKADVQEIVELTKKIKHCLRKKRRGQKGGEKISLSLNSFVPKPATPFQWHPFAEPQQLNEKIKLVKKGLAKEGGVSVTADLPKWAYLQALLARGDRRVGKLLGQAHRLRGNWSQAYRTVDLNPDFYVLRPRRKEEIFPWDFIDHGLSKDYLWQQYAGAFQEALGAK